MSELAFLGGKKAELHDKRAALDLYGASVLHAYDYLFDARLAATRNPYDPNYRGACDLYNGALESALRIVCAKKELRARRHPNDQHGLGGSGTSPAWSRAAAGGRRTSSASSSSPTTKSRG